MAETDFTEKLRRNPWIASTVVLAVAVIIIIGVSTNIYPFGRGSISEKSASDKVIKYINTLADSEVTFVSSKEYGNFYEVKVTYRGEVMPVYVSKDGKYWSSVMQALDADASQAESQNSNAQAEVKKSDKPVAEAFVFAYCPYGLQFEKALSPVYTLLKNRADIKLVFIGAMHGKYEETESIRQICIKKEYSNDKLFAYLDKFAAKKEIGDCDGNEECSSPYVKAIMTGISIDETKINSCMAGDGNTLYQQDIARAKELGVTGSPSFVINNALVQAARSPAAVLKAICSAFNTQPTECKQALSSETASPWFGSTASSASATGSAAQC